MRKVKLALLGESRKRPRTKINQRAELAELDNEKYVGCSAIDLNLILIALL